MDELNEIIERHGMDAVEEQFYLMDIFMSQYDPEQHGDKVAYLSGRLQAYHEAHTTKKTSGHSMPPSLLPKSKYLFL
jgi:hypothetical protein